DVVGEVGVGRVAGVVVFATRGPSWSESKPPSSATIPIVTSAPTTAPTTYGNHATCLGGCVVSPEFGGSRGEVPWGSDRELSVNPCLLPLHHRRVRLARDRRARPPWQGGVRKRGQDSHAQRQNQSRACRGVSGGDRCPVRWRWRGWGFRWAQGVRPLGFWWRSELRRRERREQLWKQREREHSQREHPH